MFPDPSGACLETLLTYREPVFDHLLEDLDLGGRHWVFVLEHGAVLLRQGVEVRLVTDQEDRYNKQTCCQCPLYCADVRLLTRLFLKFFWRTQVHFVGAPIPLFWTSGDVSPGSQSQGGSLTCALLHLHTMDSSDSPLMRHLLTS